MGLYYYHTWTLVKCKDVLKFTHQFYTTRFSEVYEYTRIDESSSGVSLNELSMCISDELLSRRGSERYTRSWQPFTTPYHAGNHVNLKKGTSYRIVYIIQTLRSKDFVTSLISLEGTGKDRLSVNAAETRPGLGGSAIQ